MAAVLIPLAWAWYVSLVPSPLSVMDMGTPDFGGGPAHSGHAMSTMPGMPDMTGANEVSVATLTGPKTGAPQVNVRLSAREQKFRLATGEQLDGYTLNGTSPGPVITAVQGDLVQVTLHNDNVRGGVTLHWHGVDVPNAEDGVAGVTQDAVPPGHDYVYRFVAKEAGTYWYHSHQLSDPQVRGGLWGALVIRPRAESSMAETLVAVHSYSGHRTVNGRTGVQRVSVPAGKQVRLRVINTDNGPMRTWITGGEARVAAIDGHDVNRPGPIGDDYLVVPAGGRADFIVTIPTGGGAIRLDLGGGSIAVIAGPLAATPPAARAPGQALDLLSYGAPAALPFDAQHPDRRFQYRIGRRIGFEDGKPGFWWTINGHKYPDVPMFVVSQGDVVQMKISNGGLLGADVHPIHLHGHHAVVLSRNGVAASGSPWWVDSLDVAKGQTYVVAFIADNPGIWMDHCHNLDHARSGMIAHLMYTGISEPYHLGKSSGGVNNAPE